jgi:hypothetical protein
VTGTTFDNSGYLANTLAGGGGVTIGGGASGTTTTLNYTFSNNSVSFGKNWGLQVMLAAGGVGGTAAYNGTIANNQFGTLAGVDAGSDGDSLRLDVEGNGTSSATVSGNTFAHYKESGIYIVGNNGSVASGPLSKYRIYNNTFTTPDAGTGQASSGITADIGIAVGVDNSVACLDIGGAVGFTNALGGSMPPGGTADVLLVAETAPNHIDLPGYGFTDDGTNVPAYIQGRNTGAPTVVAADSGSGTSFHTVANCN